MNKRHRAIAASLALAVAGCGAKPTDSPSLGEIVRPVNAAIPDDWCLKDDPGPAVKAIQQGASPACAEIQPANELPEEIVLPMPCDRVMVFRRISFAASHILDTTPVGLGYTERAGSVVARASNGEWTAPLSGGFLRVPQGVSESDPDSATIVERAYYIAKYEVSEPQFDARAGFYSNAKNVCPKADSSKDSEPGSVLPKSNVSFEDARRFAADYTQWLINAEGARIIAGGETTILPWKDSAPGFLRLPTEAEWEYAAWGGRSPEGSLRARGLYQIAAGEGARRPEKVEEIAGITLADAVNQQAFYIGRREPNLAGIYDMLGNVEEMMHEPFQQVTRTQNLGGVHGGILVKGGKVGDSPDQIHIGRRKEIPPYTINGPARDVGTGFRLALVAPFYAQGRNPETWEADRLNAPLNKRLETAINDLDVNVDTPGGLERKNASESISDLIQSLELRESDDPNAIRLARDALSGIELSDAQIEEREDAIARELMFSAAAVASAYGQSRNFANSTIVTFDHFLNIHSEDLNDESRIIYENGKKLYEPGGAAAQSIAALFDRYIGLVRQGAQLSDEKFERAYRFASEDIRRARLIFWNDTLFSFRKHVEVQRNIGPNSSPSPIDIELWSQDLVE